jgi:hypothetical protein
MKGIPVVAIIETEADLAKGGGAAGGAGAAIRAGGGGGALAAPAAGGRVRGAFVGDRGAAGVHGERGGDLGTCGGGRAGPGGGLGAVEDDVLAACGLSRPKQRYGRALAAAGIDWAALRDAETEEVIETLVAVPGVGRWTAEIYAKFALGHADVFAAGDLALQESARRLFDLPDAALERSCARWPEPGRRCARLLPGRCGSTTGGTLTGRASCEQGSGVRAQGAGLGGLRNIW